MKHLFFTLLSELAREVWYARNYRIISPLGQEKFLLAVRRRQKVFEKILGISLWYLQNTACTNFATEKVSVLASPGKVINEEVGIRTIQ